MEPMLPIAGAIFIGAWLMRARRNSVFAKRLFALGYQKTIGGYVRVEGDFRIRVSKLEKKDKAVRISVVIARVDNRVPSFQLVKRKPVELFVAQDVKEVGSPELEKRVHLTGNVEAMLLAFDKETRDRVQRLCSETGELLIDNTGVRARVVYRDSLELINETLQLAKRVLRPVDLTQLTARFAEEEEAGMREKIARAAWSRPELAQQIMPQALADRNPAVRAVAALYLKDPVELGKILAWRELTPQRALTCANMLRELRDPRGNAGLRAALANSEVKDVHMEIIQALLAVADETCEGEMLGAFDGGDEDVKRAAVTWFSRHGSAHCLTRLKRLEEAWLTESTLKQQAALARKVIVSRVGDLQGGEISVDVTGEQGAVSLSDEKPQSN